MANIKEGLAEVTREIGGTPRRKMIERQVQKVPADAFVAAAAISVGLSLILRILGRKSDSEFVGHWAPTMIGLAIYDKLTKGGGEEERDFTGA